MRIRLLLPLLLVTAAASAEVIRVVRLEASDNAVFSCGDRCKFRGSLPSGPLRVRIIRGTVSDLVAATTDMRYAAAGCIPLNSMLVRPRRSRRASDLLDLRFYFTERWLASGGANGEFVFVVEHDDHPDDPPVEKSSVLKLPIGRPGANYLRAGIDVSIRGPLNVRREGFAGWIAELFGSTAHAATTVGARATMSRDSPAGEAPPVAAGLPAPPIIADAGPPAAPHPANCADVVIDPDVVIFRRADAGVIRPVLVTVK